MNQTDVLVNKTVSVLGFGNILMRDDGLGPYAIKMLEGDFEFGSGVSVIDIGTPGLGIHQYLAGVNLVIIIDTVRASSGIPGEVRIYRTEEILKYGPGPRMSPHDPGLKEALLSLQFLDLAPQNVLLVGVIPEDVSAGIGLSDAVRNAIPRVEAEVIAELQRFGVSVTKRSTAISPDIWWEKADKQSESVSI